MRRWFLAVGSSVLAITAGGIVAVTAGGGSSAHGPVTYCDASRRALRYTGTDAGRFRQLLEPVAALAPPEVAPTVRALRTAAPTSTPFKHARGLWDYYNNNHCCDCIGGNNAPTIQQLERSGIDPSSGTIPPSMRRISH